MLFGNDVSEEFCPSIFRGLQSAAGLTGYSAYFLEYLEDRDNKLLRNTRKKLPVNVAQCSRARSDDHTGYWKSGLK